MSGQYKVAWLCEALLVSRSGYYDWKERRHSPGSRQLENMRLRERIRVVATHMAVRAWLRCWAVPVGVIASPGSCGWSEFLPDNAPSIAP
jgi:hypothetical protein